MKIKFLPIVLLITLIALIASSYIEHRYSVPIRHLTEPTAPNVPIKPIVHAVHKTTVTCTQLKQYVKDYGFNYVQDYYTNHLKLSSSQLKAIKTCLTGQH